MGAWGRASVPRVTVRFVLFLAPTPSAGLAGVVGASLLLGDHGHDAPAAAARQVVGPDTAHAGADLDLDEARDVLVAEADAARVLLPVSPGAAVRRPRILLDAGEQDV